jgi:hypothetical protein
MGPILYNFLGLDYGNICVTSNQMLWIYSDIIVNYGQKSFLGLVSYRNTCKSFDKKIKNLNRQSSYTQLADLGSR